MWAACWGSGQQTPVTEVGSVRKTRDSTVADGVPTGAADRKRGTGWVVRDGGQFGAIRRSSPGRELDPPIPGALRHEVAHLAVLTCSDGAFLAFGVLGFVL